MPGTYHETVYIDKDDIRIIGVIDAGRRAVLDGEKKLNDAILYSGNNFVAENLGDPQLQGQRHHGPGRQQLRDPQQRDRGVRRLRHLSAARPERHRRTQRGFRHRRRRHLHRHERQHPGRAQRCVRQRRRHRDREQPPRHRRAQLRAQQLGRSARVRHAGPADQGHGRRDLP